MNIKKAMTDWTGISIGLVLTALLWSFILSQRPAVKVIVTPNEPIVVFSGQPYELCRKVEYLRDARMEMSKALIKNRSNGDTITINFPKVTFERKEGVQTICRTMVLPQGLSLGEWELHTYLTSRFPPFWRRDSEIPIVKLFVSVYPSQEEINESK